MEIVSLKTAKKNSIKRYFTGRPCKRGHIAERITRDRSCCECERIRQLRWNKENKEWKRQYDERWRVENKERRIKANFLWRSKNPEKMRANSNARRARKLNAEGRYTAKDACKIYDSQRGKCAICALSLGKAGKHLDHIVPLVSGGTNYPENLQWLCPSCNLSKNKKGS